MRSAAALVPLAALVAAVTGVALYALSRPAAPPPRRVKLAVLVVFDQLRGDYLRQWQPLFRADGFARLQRDGAWFTNCHYPYAVTLTGPGHASVLTGATPDKHGIVMNEWVENGNGVYCAGHPRYRPVPEPPKFPPDPEDKSKPPTEKKVFGTPEFLLSETVADVLKEATGGRAKVFGLSLKDRSAILPTGKRPDGAYWFDAGVFYTSTYYTETIRDNGRVHPWVTEFNATRPANRWFGKEWARFRPDLDYFALGAWDEKSGAAGPAFSHKITGGRSKIGPKYYESLAGSPFGNTLLLEFAKECVTAEKLGADDVPDLLVVSFSSNDLIGHARGPDSQEVLDVTLRSDAVVAELLAFLDRTVGPDQYLLGLTADHGVCPLPEVSRAKGVAPFAMRIEAGDLEKGLNAHLTAAYPASKSADGKPAKWVEGKAFPWFYLNPRLASAAKVPREAVAAEAAKYLATLPAVARAFTRTELSGPVSDADEIAVRVKRSFHPARCGDVCVILHPYSIAWKAGATHGSPYAYDTHVPLLVYGPGVRGGERDEPTTPQAMASIFAKWLDVRRPKDAAFPLPETLE